MFNPADASRHAGGATHSQTLPAPLGVAFTAEELAALCTLRRRYREGRDAWSARELAHLRFVRWRYQIGRLVP
jgi:hypothetical protein